MKKIKQINCVSCPKFCRKEDLNELKQLINKLKNQGYSEVEFNCEIGRKIIKNFTPAK